MSCLNSATLVVPSARVVLGPGEAGAAGRDDRCGAGSGCLWTALRQPTARAGDRHHQRRQQRRPRAVRVAFEPCRHRVPPQTSVLRWWYPDDATDHAPSPVSRTGRPDGSRRRVRRAAGLTDGGLDGRRALRAARLTGGRADCPDGSYGQCRSPPDSRPRCQVPPWSPCRSASYRCCLAWASRPARGSSPSTPRSGPGRRQATTPTPNRPPPETTPEHHPHQSSWDHAR